MAAEALVRELTVDLQRARGRQVLYLEGETDIDPFFALCGVPSPIDGLRGDVLVKALTGVKEVRRRIELAEKTQGLRGHFAGIIDGDGRPLADLDAWTPPRRMDPVARDNDGWRGERR